MTVLYIIDPGTVGGATHSFLEVISQMKKLGVTPIVCTGVQNQLNEELEKAGIQNICIGHKTVLTQIGEGIKRPFVYLREKIKYEICKRQALNIIKTSVNLNTIDLIHTNSARNDIGCYLNKKYDIPHVMHIREFSDLDFGCVSLDKEYISIFNNYTTCFIAISDAIKKYWTEIKGIDRNKTITVYNGIHHQDISLSTDKSKKDDVLRLVITGGVYPTKGQHLLVDAVKLLPEGIRKNLKLDVIGWGSPSYIKEMKNNAASFGWLDNLTFWGPRDDVHRMIGNYQVGCTCSRAEGFGRSTAEYMHGQLGVIASNSGACPELIENERCGLLFESGNASDLARCIKLYYNNRELLIQHSQAARMKAQSLYTDEINAHNILKLYNKVINGSE